MEDGTFFTAEKDQLFWGDWREMDCVTLSCQSNISHHACSAAGEGADILIESVLSV